MGSDMREWQSIETAPKDGTNVVLYFANSKGGVIASMVNGAWRLSANGTGFALDTERYEPTHWMPLPDPPEVK